MVNPVKIPLTSRKNPLKNPLKPLKKPLRIPKSRGKTLPFSLLNAGDPLPGLRSPRSRGYLERQAGAGCWASRGHAWPRPGGGSVFMGLWPNSGPNRNANLLLCLSHWGEQNSILQIRTKNCLILMADGFIRQRIDAEAHRQLAAGSQVKLYKQLSRQGPSILPNGLTLASLLAC